MKLYYLRPALMCVYVYVCLSVCAFVCVCVCMCVCALMCCACCLIESKRTEGSTWTHPTPFGSHIGPCKMCTSVSWTWCQLPCREPASMECRCWGDMLWSARIALHHSLSSWTTVDTRKKPHHTPVTRHTSYITRFLYRNEMGVYLMGWV